MKTVKIVLIALLLAGFTSTQAKARQSTANGLIIGAAVGTVLGLIVGNEMHSEGYRTGQVDHRSVLYGPPHPEQRSITYRSHSPRVFNSNRKYRETVLINKGRGSYRETIKTDCRERR